MIIIPTIKNLIFSGLYNFVKFQWSHSNKAFPRPLDQSLACSLAPPDSRSPSLRCLSQRVCDAILPSARKRGRQRAIELESEMA